MASTDNALFSLQTKLVGAFVLVTLAALALTGTIFVFAQRGEREQQALDHVIAASPAIFASFTLLAERDAPTALLGEFADAAEEEFDVRVLIIDRADGTVVIDSGAALTDQQLALPDDVSFQGRARLRPYASWHPADGTPGDNLILISTTGRLQGFPRTERLALLLAVPESTVARAWLGLLPELSIAAAVALPAAALLAILIARYISRPLEQLTVASQRMAEGHFDVRVSVDRRDEVGRLAQAFSSMAMRVGEAHSQMRALVANVSHDLKTPLTSILGFGQALRDGTAEDDADVRRMGGVIHDEAARLTARLNDLLYISEIESGQALLEREQIDVSRLLEKAIERIEPDVSGRAIQASLDAAQGLVVSADGPKLERAIENLLDNARKYTPSGGAIRVRSYADTSGPCIEVVNTAPDVSPDEVPRLFERFYRRGQTPGQSGARAEGSGLGLPIARDLIELHGGTLDAAVEDGEFAVRIRLPAEESTG